jgi:hypothetical protein
VRGSLTIHLSPAMAPQATPTTGRQIPKTSHKACFEGIRYFFPTIMPNESRDGVSG